MNSMKARASSLNPYATSYIPLARRGGASEESKGYEIDESKIGNESGWLQKQRYAENHETPDELKKVVSKKNHSGFGSSSHSAELGGGDVDHDMNLAYLQMIFPGVSDESLSSVYIANNGDMEATVEMLNQLEVHSGDFSENLPESLDIGDIVAEDEGKGGSSSSSTSQKLKKVAVGDGSWWNPPK